MKTDKKLLVLVVDDNVSLQEALHAWASCEESIDLRSALNVTSGLAIFYELKGRLDVVAVDGQIPGALSSLDFMREVSASGFLKGKGLAIAISTEPAANRLLRGGGCDIECEKSHLHTVLKKLACLGS
ncbi:MAG: hypothetical protein V1885_01240 [Candidatus Brennerbacteria bacterium]